MQQGNWKVRNSHLGFVKKEAAIKTEFCSLPKNEEKCDTEMAKVSIKTVK